MGKAFQTTLTRRDLLRWTGAIGLGLSATSLLAAVAPASAAPTGPAPVATPGPIQKVDVTGIGEGKIPVLPLLTSKKFAGVEVVVASEAGPPISSPIQKFGAQWEAATGAKIKLVTYPFGSMFEKLRSALAGGGYAYDLFNFTSGWAGDVMGGGWVDPVPDDVKSLITLDDYYPTYLQSASWGGTMYGLPFDGNVHNLYYRRDLFTNADYMKQFKDKYGWDLKPPATWEQYHQVGEFFNSFDWSGTGRTGYGAVEPMSRGTGSVYMLVKRGVTYAKAPGDNNVFFEPDTMKPRINEPGWIQALADWVNDIKIGPSNALELGFSETRPLFAGGQAAMTAEWGDIGTLSYDASVTKIKGNCGTAVLPGASKVYDYRTKAWMDTPNGNVAPYLAVTAWLFGVPTSAQQKEAAWDLAAFLCNPVSSAVEVALPDSGIQPSRASTIGDPGYLVAAGMDAVDAKEYLDNIAASIGNPNAVLDLRIPGTADYYDALDVESARAMAGEIGPEEAMNNAAKKWDEITDRLGRDKQKDAYANSLK